jgi:hypothetical protein
VLTWSSLAPNASLDLFELECEEEALIEQSETGGRPVLARRPDADLGARAPDHSAVSGFIKQHREPAVSSILRRWQAFQSRQNVCQENPVKVRVLTSNSLIAPTGLLLRRREQGAPCP